MRGSCIIIIIIQDYSIYYGITKLGIIGGRFTISLETYCETAPYNLLK